MKKKEHLSDDEDEQLDATEVTQTPSNEQIEQIEIREEVKTANEAESPMTMRELGMRKEAFDRINFRY